MGVVTGVVLFIRAMLASRATIAAENLALRHKLGVLQRTALRWAWLTERHSHPLSR